MGIVRKNFLIVTTMMITTFLLIFGLLYYAVPIYYNQAKLQELRQSYLSIAKDLEGKSEEAILDAVDKYDQKEANLLLSLEDETGQVLYPDLSDEMVYLNDQNYLEQGDFDQIGAWTETIFSSDDKAFVLHGEYGFHSLSDISQTLVTFYPFVLVLIFLLVSIVAFIYSRLSNKRIRALSEMSRQMQSLDTGLACQVEGKDEVARLAENINTLYDHLLLNMEQLKNENERTLARQKQVSDFARMTSHELKTPIASMLGLVEGMIYNVGDFQNHDKYLLQCRDILQEQSNLVQSVLEATNLELMLEAEQKEFDLAVLLNQELDRYRHLAQVKNYRFSIDLQPVTIKGNELMLLKTIKNILDNAFRYTLEGGQVRLVLKNQQLIIENEAEKLLSPEELERVFQPFYRPDFSRSKKDGGTGIGLYLVQEVLNKHGFTYQFEATEEGFMRFTIDFQS